MLTTNYREFALVEQGEKGAIEMARYSLAVGEEEFWEMAKHPQKPPPSTPIHFVSF